MEKKSINSFIHDGKEYVSVEYILANTNVKSPVIIFNAMDEFEVDVVKISKKLFYEKRQAMIVMTVLSNKKQYLIEIINQKLAEEFKE